MAKKKKVIKEAFPPAEVAASDEAVAPDDDVEAKAPNSGDVTGLAKPFAQIAAFLRTTSVSYKERNPKLADIYNHYYNMYNHYVAQLKLNRSDRFVKEFNDLDNDGKMFVVNNEALDNDQTMALESKLKSLGVDMP